MANRTDNGIAIPLKKENSINQGLYLITEKTLFLYLYHLTKR